MVSNEELTKVDTLKGGKEDDTNMIILTLNSQSTQLNMPSTKT